MSDTPTLIHRTDINAQSYDLNGVLVDVRLTKLSDGRWRVDEIVAAGTDDEVCACIDALVADALSAGSDGEDRPENPEPETDT